MNEQSTNGFLILTAGNLKEILKNCKEDRKNEFKGENKTLLTPTSSK